MKIVAVRSNPVGDWMDEGWEGACMLTATRASVHFSDAWLEGFGVPKQQTNGHWARQEEIINYPLVVTQEDIPNTMSNLFHVVNIQ